MVRIITYILLITVFIGCTSERIVTPKISRKLETASEDAKREVIIHFVKGQSYEAQEMYTEAAEEYQRSLSYEKSPGIYYSLAKVFVKLNRLYLALPNAINAANLDTTNFDYASLLADIYLASGKRDLCVNIYERWVEKDSNALMPSYKLAQLYEKDKPLSAVKLYKKILDNEGFIWDVLVRMSTLYEKINDNKELLGIIKDLAEYNSSDMNLQKLLLEYQIKNKQYDSALITCNNLIAQQPEDVELLETKTDIFVVQEKLDSAYYAINNIFNLPLVNLQEKLQAAALFYEKSVKDTSVIKYAEKLFEKLDKDTSLWVIKNYLGIINVRRANYNAAEKYFNQQIALAPEIEDSYIKLGIVYNELKKYKKAIEILNRGIDRFPNNYQIHYYLGVTYIQSGAIDSAEIVLKKAVSIKSTDHLGFGALGYSANYMKHTNDAINYYITAINLDSSDVESMAALGSIYNGLGDTARCDSLYQLALSKDSTNVLINNNYAYALTERTSMLPYALTLINVSLSKEPQNANYLDTRGWIYFKMGNYKRAEDDIKASLQMNASNSVVLDHYGDVLYKLGKIKQAKEYWNKAFKIDKNIKGLKDKIEKGAI